MSWHYKSPQNFPALYLNVLRNAALAPNEEIIFAADTEANLKVMAEKFRWFKWCILHRNAMLELSQILEQFEIRTKIKQDACGFVLYLTARPKKLSEFFRLNPDLGSEIIAALAA